MSPADCAKLLTVITSFDRRTLGEADVHAWMGAVGDLTFDECRNAVVKHYAQQTEWVMPAHVRRLALAARQDEAMRALPGDPGDLVPQPDWFRATVAEHKRRQHALNEQRKERGEPLSYGDTVMRPIDGRLR